MTIEKKATVKKATAKKTTAKKTVKTAAKKTVKKAVKKTTKKGVSLLIVESPAKAKAIGKYLGNKFIVKASVGHVKDLPVSKLGVDLEDNFKPQYDTIKGKGNFLKEIRKLSKEVDNVYLAPDPDREGEIIAWHIANEISKSGCNIHRVLFNEITPAAVKKATENPTHIDENKVNAQKARRVLDRVVGYQISPLLWDKIRRGLSAGRVQSVAVRLICDRENEINAFNPREYWTIKAEFTHQNKQFTAKLSKLNGKDFELNNEEDSSNVLAALEGAAYRVCKVERKEKKRHPVAPFITSKLQQDSSRKLRFSSKKTMMIAQQLYEGIEVGKEGQIGLITYMRTDSTRLSETAVKDARDLIQNLYGSEYLPATGKAYKNKKGAQDAHEAIRPTYPDKKPEDIASFLTADQLALYRLIWTRFIASQTNPAKFDVLSIDISAADYTFHATGSTLKFDGFMRVYTEGVDTQPEPVTDSKMLPAMEVNDNLACNELVPNQHFTQPPPRFNEPLLIKVLEEEGIGRPSTYATIISTIQARNYVDWNAGKFSPSELGVLVNDMLVKFFPDILNVNFTANMEEKLDFVEEGKEDWMNLISGFYGGFKETLDKAKVEMKNLKKEETPTDIKCEKCGQIMNIKWGKNGKFLACSAYPDCKSTKEYEIDENGQVKVVSREDAMSDETCDKCGKQMIIKTGRFGRFLACSGYPECKSTKGMTTGVKCPQEGCEGELCEKKTKRGKTFYSCNKYPTCKFALWDKPVKTACPDCGATFLVEKVKSGEHACANEECDYKTPIQGAN